MRVARVAPELLHEHLDLLAQRRHLLGQRRHLLLEIGDPRIFDHELRFQLCDPYLCVHHVEVDHILRPTSIPRKGLARGEVGPSADS